MPLVETPYGTFAVSRRATWGFSVVQARRSCTHRYKGVEPGEYVTVEHRKQPMFLEHVGMGWCVHVATFDLDGHEIPLKTVKAGWGVDE